MMSLVFMLVCVIAFVGSIMFARKYVAIYLKRGVKLGVITIDGRTYEINPLSETGGAK